VDFPLASMDVSIGSASRCWENLLLVLIPPAACHEISLRRRLLVVRRTTRRWRSLLRNSQPSMPLRPAANRMINAWWQRMGGAFTAVELKPHRADVATKRQSLDVRHQTLLARRMALQQTLGQTEALVKYCARVRERLQTFSLEEQYLAFDALVLQVTWVPKQPLRIQASPVVEASTSIRICR
jgi:hypothetical protein